MRFAVAKPAHSPIQPARERALRARLRGDDRPAGQRRFSFCRATDLTGPTWRRRVLSPAAVIAVLAGTHSTNELKAAYAITYSTVAGCSPKDRTAAVRHRVLGSRRHIVAPRLSNAQASNIFQSRQ